MPARNNFQHATYVRANPEGRLAYRELQPGAPADSPAWHDAMAGLGKEASQAGVRVVLFMHGTFLGTDPFGMQRLDEAGGLKRGYSRGIPGLETLLALMRVETNGLPTALSGQTTPYPNDDQTKQLIDEQSGDACNFSADYVQVYDKAVNRDAPRPIICERYLWSSEHHHLGRAHAAISLLNRIRALSQHHQLGAGDRILVEGHGQAGLVLALVSNLLAPGNASGQAGFFGVLKASSGSTHHAFTKADIDQLEQLLSSGQALGGVSLDVVTFGTPIRYGWDPSGLGKLLHIVNHRPMRNDGKQWLAKMELPHITMEMPIAWGGDYIQQLAIGGTDAVPASPDAQAANKALWEILEPYDGFERWLECARKCVRCANDGLCLLVDYKDAGSSNARDHVFGHAAYTRRNALLFNTAEIVQALYTAPTSS